MSVESLAETIRKINASGGARIRASGSSQYLRDFLKEALEKRNFGGMV